MSENMPKPSAFSSIYRADDTAIFLDSIQNFRVADFCCPADLLHLSPYPHFKSFDPFQAPAEAICFRVVRPCRRACVRASMIHVLVLCFRDISSICWRIFAKLLSLVHLGTEMNLLHFGVKRSKVKVMAWPNTSQIFMFPRYLQYLLTDFRQTFVTGASRDRDDLITFLGQKVKVQGHAIAAKAHSTRRYRWVQLFLVISVLDIVHVSAAYRATHHTRHLTIR